MKKGGISIKAVQYDLSEYINRNAYAGTGENNKETRDDIICRKAAIWFWAIWTIRVPADQNQMQGLAVLLFLKITIDK